MQASFNADEATPPRCCTSSRHRSSPTPSLLHQAAPLLYIFCLLSPPCVGFNHSTPQQLASVHAELQLTCERSVTRPIPLATTARNQNATAWDTTPSSDNRQPASPPLAFTPLPPTNLLGSHQRRLLSPPPRRLPRDSPPARMVSNRLV